MGKDDNKRKIAVFIASPGDLTAERQQFRDAIRQLNVGFADGANVEFEAMGWEDTLATTGRRNQSVINAEIDRCDVFFLVMHRRWGQASPDAKPYSSYTEEEFHRALERWRETKRPEIFVFFKRVDAAQEADAGPQLQKVLEFRKHLEETRHVLYRYFDNGEKSFLKEVDSHLRAFVKGELSEVNTTCDIVILPIMAINEVNKAKEEAKRQAKLAEEANRKAETALLKIEGLQLEAAEEAADLAGQGFLEKARGKFVRLFSDTVNIRVLFLSYEFFYRTGDFVSALGALERWIELSGADTKSPDTATAYGKLGNLYKTQGDLERAEAMFGKSLAIDEALGHKEGMATAYGNLGKLYKTRGDLVRAEAMFEKSLAIDEALGHKEGMARDFGNLGNLYKTLGDLARAEAMFEKSLAIDETLGHKEGMASDFGNLGILYKTRGDLARAEAMFEKSLAIEEVLGHKEGMATAYGNLGKLFKTRGDLARAEAMFEKSLAIDEALGCKEGMASDFCNLGILYQARGDLDRAEAMF
ncbi:MAG: tetratricopeptide repeat protein [Pseudomonadota bacterium]